ncbi:MAG: hypothetical protein R6U98_24760, partial [Pirellulaceae bacterium]
MVENKETKEVKEEKEDAKDQKKTAKAKVEEKDKSTDTGSKTKEKTSTEKDVADSVKEIIDKVEKLTVLELADLVKALEDKFGVSAAAPVAAACAATTLDSEETTLLALLDGQVPAPRKILELIDHELSPTIPELYRELITGLILGYEDRTLSHYKENDLSAEAHGFVENSYRGGLTPEEF